MFENYPRSQFLWIVELEICEWSGLAKTHQEGEALEGKTDYITE